AITASIETLDGKRLALDRTGISGQAANVACVDEFGARHLNANSARKRHHGVFVFGDGWKTCGGQLDDPGAAHAVCGYGQAARRLHDRGELELYAGKGKAERCFGDAFAVVGLGIFGCALSDVLERRDLERTGEIGSKHRQEKEFPLRLYTGSRGEVI